jgi:type I restriction enzyme S subunit
VQPGSHVACGIPIVRVGDVRNGEIQVSEPLRISEEIEAKYSRTRLRGGELIITIVGSVGQTAIVPKSLAGWNVARAIAVLPIRSEIGAYWVQLALRAPSVREQIDSRLNTTVQATLNLGDIAELPILVPPLSDRERISSILAAIDDKIKLNRRMNETLEAMARALFKDWFVDFGPTRAKQEGMEPYLAPELWSLFPERLDAEGKPEGWDLATIGQRFALTMGQSPPGSTYNEVGDGLPFFQGRTDFGFRYPKRRIFCSAPTRIAEMDDTLVSVRAPVGDINLAWEKSCIGRGVAALRHPNGYRSFTYHTAWALQLQLQQYEHTGTVFGAINKKQFESLRVCSPSRELLASFEDVVGPLDSRVRMNTDESRTLAQTRDLLLPKLMSGEIRIQDAEKVVGRVSEA